MSHANLQDSINTKQLMVCIAKEPPCHRHRRLHQPEGNPRDSFPFFLILFVVFGADALHFVDHPRLPLPHDDDQAGSEGGACEANGEAQPLVWHHDSRSASISITSQLEAGAEGGGGGRRRRCGRVPPQAKARL
jgi:hypothetical protein